MCVYIYIYIYIYKLLIKWHFNFHLVRKMHTIFNTDFVTVKLKDWKETLKINSCHF